MYLPSCYFPQGSRLAGPELRRSSAQTRRRNMIEFYIEDAKIHRKIYHSLWGMVL